MKPDLSPIGLVLAQTAKSCGRAFEDALADAGGSTPVWLVLRALAWSEHRTQTDIAAEVGIQGPTLTHHLNNMERDGLILRERAPGNRRAHVVSLTAEGQALFERLKAAAIAHDVRIRQGFTPEDVARLRDLLNRLAGNVPAAPLL